MSVYPPPSSSFPTLPLPQIRTKSVRHLRGIQKTVLFSAMIIVSAFIVSIIAFYGYIAWMLGNPAHDALRSNPKLAVGLSYEDVSFPSLTDASHLNGWYIPSVVSSTKTVIFSHSYAGNREEPWMPIYKIAAALHKKNFNVLMFDYAYANKANHVSFTGGIKESKELLGAVRFVKQLGASEVIVWGFSMGAGTTLQAALQTKDINAMILDSTFIATPDTMFMNIKSKLNLPEYPSKMLIHYMFPYINGTGLTQIPYQKVLSTAYSVPIFFIHGKEDERSPYTIIQHLADNQSANALSTIWIKPKAKHELVYDTDPKGYFKKTMEFIDKVSL
ncbi:alpha/beta hydrolase [Paenibacillus psychroresistens]|uniref:Alpha/beta hydrolase n=1 Tax=Paenibacillus psychroresistens TaxID=1778678 RepID=A0A6B8RQE2_9BACL|nr:alpha/beta hydrolase [Paenibacillus psychroresistens]QGQ98590.1 alpha/beta hydrolase [Paenibacillus psychroresistens]